MTSKEIVTVSNKIGLKRKDGNKITRPDVGKDLYNIKKQGLATNWTDVDGRMARGDWVPRRRDVDNFSLKNAINGVNFS